VLTPHSWFTRPTLPGQEIWQDYSASALIGARGHHHGSFRVDIALWDIAKSDAPVAGAGGCRPALPIYNTHAGWLNFSKEQLAAEASGLLPRIHGPEDESRPGRHAPDYERVKSSAKSSGTGCS
jgi:hypothetical protein